jgi:hypothetical protein
MLLALVLSGASTACALAAVGGVLYANHPELSWALKCFAAWGFVAGLGCGGLHLRAHGAPVQSQPSLSTHALHTLVRAAEASARAERKALRARVATTADQRARTELAALVALVTPVQPAVSAGRAAPEPSASPVAQVTAPAPAPHTATEEERDTVATP